VKVKELDEELQNSNKSGVERKQGINMLALMLSMWDVEFEDVRLNWSLDFENPRRVHGISVKRVLVRP
jgi:hypothetical protein